MPRLLHVNASPREDSKSLAIAQQFLGTYRDCRPDLEVDTWNLFDSPLPDYTRVAAAAKVAAVMHQEMTPQQEAEWARDREVFDRFIAADEYLFNVPMWNHGVPYVLKQWIDIITQPGWVFGFDPSTGYSGMVDGKRAFVVYTTGIYQAGRPPAFGSDFHATYFDDWLRFTGIKDITTLFHAGNDAPFPDPPEVALAKAKSRACDMARDW